MQSGIILKVDDYIGLSWLIRAEREIAEHLARNEVVELDPRERAIIEHVLDHAADFLRKPGFVLTDEQRTAILTTFQHVPEHWRVFVVRAAPKLQGLIGTSKARNAATPIGAMLNYGFAAVLSQCTRAVVGAGLDP